METAIKTDHLLPYSEVRNMQRTKSQEPQIPVEHAISLPLPTQRTGQPAYAFFAAPAMRKADHPVEQGAPDRWWLVDAATGQVISYSLCAETPFSETQFTKVTLPPVTVSSQEMQAMFSQIENLMNTLAPAFFNGESGDATAKQSLRDTLQRALPEPLQPQYRALTPDFFAWLEA